MKTRESELLYLSVVIDLLLLNGIFFLLFLTVFHVHWFHEPGIYLAFLALNLARISSFVLFRRRIIYYKKGFRPRLRRMLMRSVIFIALLVLIYLPIRHHFDHRPQVLLAGTLIVFLLAKLAFNYTYYKLVKRRIKYSTRVRKVVLLGDNEVMTSLQNIITYNPALNYKYEGTYSPDQTTTCDEAYNTLEQRVLNEGIQVMFLAVNSVDDLHAGCWNLKELQRNCSRWGVRLFLVPTVEPDTADDYKIDRIHTIKVYNPQRIPLDIAENQIKKRLFDLFFSSVFLVFAASWMFLIIAILIKLTSRGPVFFVQDRTGINNRIFKCIKFRSMYINGDADKRQATKNDPRITPIGRFMRKYNIDELPQFVNVFYGDMSVVGPRPHMLAHTELFSREVENYLIRHYVKPGITGWAQVNGYRGETSEHWQIEKRVQYDHEYIRNWTFEWDFVIVWKTIFSMKAFRNAG